MMNRSDQQKKKEWGGKGAESVLKPSLTWGEAIIVETLYGLCLPVALVVLVVHTISYFCDSMSTRYCRKGIVSSTYAFYRGKTLHTRRDFVLLGCAGTYFIEDKTKQYSTIAIIHYNTLHPDPCDYSRGFTCVF